MASSLTRWLAATRSLNYPYTCAASTPCILLFFASGLNHEAKKSLFVSPARLPFPNTKSVMWLQPQSGLMGTDLRSEVLWLIADNFHVEGAYLVQHEHQVDPQADGGVAAGVSGITGIRHDPRIDKPGRDQVEVGLIPTVRIRVEVPREDDREAGVSRPLHQFVALGDPHG